jgi:hypothetical protein
MVIDFEKFAVDAIKSIDELRSTNADLKNLDNNPTKPVESRINAFYRAIGLPAFTTNVNIKDKELNNGNFHKSDPNDKKVESLLKDAEKREADFSLELSEEAQKKFLDNIEETVLSRIKSGTESGKAKKGTLFPMIVDGNIPILPQSKRVGGAFHQKNSSLVNNDITYRRPLIETIVLLRLRSDGFVSDVDRKKLQNSFSDLQKEGFFDGSSDNLLSIYILDSLLSAITKPDGIMKIIDFTIERLGRVRRQVRDSFKDSKEAIVAEEQPAVGESDGLGEIEKLKEKRELLKSESNARITLLEYDDTLESSETTRNMKDALFAQILLDTLLSDTSDIDKTINEGEAEKKNLDRVHKRLNRNMDLILGAYSGISGIDVLAIITALFLIDEKDLLGLLNKESTDRLSKLKKGAIFTKSNVHEAISALENKTSEIFKIIDEKTKIVDLIEKNVISEV